MPPSESANSHSPHHPEDEPIPIAPSLAEIYEGSSGPPPSSLVDSRVALLSGAAIIIAMAAAIIARLLTGLIGLVTNLSYYGRFSTTFASSAGNHLGVVAIIVPAIGGILVGFMARYGSTAIRGHGIPEAMEQVLVNQSRIAPRITFLKPLSAAIAIGTGGPFGAEGPIIATGGALGSLVGQLLHTTATERKTLLAAGAAAGMTATFGSPVSAVLLAVELLLFEFKPRSVIPVALASAAATTVRYMLVGSDPVFPMPHIASPTAGAMLFYCLLGLFIGLVSVGVTKLVYAVEDGFEHLPIHWMWWPALGGLVVGVIGLVSPHTLGVGYDNIEHIVNGSLFGRAALLLCLFKFVSWCISLGSGTSGGTLAPIFTIGGGLGSALGSVAAAFIPGVDARVAAVVGMAALFAGASRAVLASIVFAFETTLQPLALLPLLAGCVASYAISCLLMRHTIMTEKIARRGVRVPVEYSADYLDQVLAGSVGIKPVVMLEADASLESVRAWIASDNPDAQHQGYPVVDKNNTLVGVLTRRDLLDLSRDGAAHIRELIHKRPSVAYEDSSLREAADHMVRDGVGRLPVVRRSDPGTVVGILTRSDLLSVHGRRLHEAHVKVQTLHLRNSLRGGPASNGK